MLVLIAGAASARPANPWTSGTVRYVTDGDTFRLTSGERIRIADIDAPETHVRQAKCAREIEKGRAATAKARALLDGRRVRFQPVGRSYNRVVARVSLEGRDVGDTLVAMGAARAWLRRHPKPDWCS
ncbi:thermonuclease family protein [Sphingobium sp. AP50]|uniref:thermonuclease family protein n=1 Tax=Sphingobium sp. AP50 TaxID=1884369 RepID=UPI00210C75E4|nr:thermonuclease family protein [Sphingobium sp. AP50]